ncbi:PstS family phosphate ABC transporter substrate-binding protein [Metabacillus malikii]|uniref:Phosphate transport system substrate-binding protein n=1 Tax=Metabacillus malikii TaxID=1504265 RepID=A0ABT9ZHD2_9BACI|nr:substrate-binding domain-containing protein [Metabacillus malikii]MDQ0231703.1 phosphate transport system substrate-binding protein [Metabacillus malikii]
MKTFATVITVLFFIIGGFIATIIASLSRHAEFYGTFVPITAAGLATIMILAIHGHMKKKFVKQIAISFVAICMISLICFEGYQAYIKGLEVVSNQDVDLSEYQPFQENTKAVMLNEPSTFKIDDIENLPRLDGATALYPVYASFGQAVYPKKDYSLEESEIVSSQTSGAFDKLIHGSADIAFMAHPSEEQMNYAKDLGVELTLTPIGREAFVFFVHTNNRVDELTLEQIKSIYAGEITNWHEVGGDKEEIKAFQRPEGSGSQSALQKLMDGKHLMEPPSEDIVSAMGGIIEETSNYQNRKNAIGFSFRHFSQNMVTGGKIKHLAIDGIPPTIETIQNETYPIVSEFYAITAGSKNPHVKPFLDWMQSEQGQEIVNLSGYVPLK